MDTDKHGFLKYNRNDATDAKKDFSQRRRDAEKTLRIRYIPMNRDKLLDTDGHGFLKYNRNDAKDAKQTEDRRQKTGVSRTKNKYGIYSSDES